MTIRSDPEKNETRALIELVDFAGKNVLEIGCGDGRITWGYAHTAAHVTAIDPFEKSILRARENQPESLREQVMFRHIAFEDLALESDPDVYDIVILSWALCWMEIAGMVHALEEIKRILKPSGFLVDIHPVPEGYYIEARQGEGVLFSERRRLNMSEDVLEAEKALARVVEENHFELEAQSTYNLLTYATSVAELRGYWEEQGAFNEGPKDPVVAEREEELFARVNEIVIGSGGKAEVVIIETARIARLKPIK